MNEDDAEAVVALLNPLLRALEMLAFISRHLHPPDFEELMASVGTPDEELRSALARQSDWPRHLSGIRSALDAACDAAREAFAGLREILQQGGDVRDVYRALRIVPKGLEALYPLAGVLPPVNRFFLDPSLRSDTEVQARFLGACARDNTGVMQFGERERGGFWLYVPENYLADRAWPLVMALHGGSGTGRLFLWSWLRDARSRGAILVTPTSVGSTWALMGPDVDTPNLTRILELIRSKWNVDASRVAPHRNERWRDIHIRVGARGKVAVHASCTCIRGVSSHVGPDGRCRPNARAADPHHPWSARLDVPRGVGAAGAAGLVEDGCRGDLSGG